MTVRELREKLEQAEDDHTVMIEGQDQDTECLLVMEDLQKRMVFLR